MSASCPYGATDCPKVMELEDRMDKMEDHLSSIYSLLWGIMGGVLTTIVGIFGVLIV